jgi:hypothetical protein
VYERADIKRYFPPRCWATGSGLERAVAGQEASFTVYTVDTSGDIQGAGANINVQQHGPATLDFKRTEIDDGIVRCVII